MLDLGVLTLDVLGSIHTTTTHSGSPMETPSNGRAGMISSALTAPAARQGHSQQEHQSEYSDGAAGTTA